MKNRILFFLIASCAILIGLYPLIYVFLSGIEFGLLATKSNEVKSNINWWVFFYLHITFGGLALLVGWLQFISKIRTKRPWTHRTIGLFYFTAVMISGVSSLYLAFYAEFFLSKMALGILGVLWLLSAQKALISVKQRNFNQHYRWAFRNYALTFAGVTLRIWLPLFLFLFKGDFSIAYQWVTWFCWVPNLLLSEFILRQKDQSSLTTALR